MESIAKLRLDQGKSGELRAWKQHHLVRPMNGYKAKQASRAGRFGLHGVSSHSTRKLLY